ncbi:Peptidase S1 and S6, chymotrypsin/Hap [Trichormus variabilis ATCC 29413]|uniref:Peptidase S1 and S6, chymotrypsin/Hap n=2 Tax=Anabaena variabilis TaxID=264691 RepID=Q3MAF8_TRIV2|nr:MULTISPECIES: HhoA/HhoB/HtrA family serine endopeptidase [Nostocaceae]ABA22028.1 Peptidase S1 and S6, chymotrypsin/Hap [Trichormus variabilis ATCC 29413]MBC1217454.1 trypsin-like peptidase domain-containing protein [Trichormus variabilis ARAD]MBC1258598.1 trypsin-like peptidase domain-containing protein [Trichormus variabilis V5]MBC1270409.1 trypsin-like peptidase domain-containing protein [Trichormus variabilis FSR]MBC1305357.1 trypsin-like peptidase domain-containing protein [Trichormus v
MNLSLKQLAVYLSLLVVGGSAGLLGSRYLLPQNRSFQQLKNVTVGLPSESVASNPVIGSAANNGGDNVNFIASAVQKVGPAVVRINATRKVANPISDVLKNPLLRRFFGEDEQPIPQERIERGTGSGFILSEDGQLLTNAHVVADTDTVQVTLKDGRTFEGKVLGVDQITDVAVVKIPGRNLPTVNLGNSQNLIPGQWAIAIGNPLGLDNTVTIGIISATDRTSAQVGVPDKRVSFIQTDAAINPGNSGGPLLNAQGEVIGVNTAIRADAQGLGFAIPIETAARVANELFTKGSVQHPFLGIEMTDLSPSKKQQINIENKLNIRQDTGVVIKGVLDDSPAKEAGLLPGDVIQKINGKTVKTSAQVQKSVESSTVGDILTVEVNRSGEILTLKVQSGVYPNR